MHHFPFHISDINHATGRLSLEEFGALVRLYMDYLKAEEGQLLDVEELAFSIGARSASEKKSLERVLKRFFTVAEPSKRLKSGSCDQIIEDYRASGVQSRYANLCRHWEKVNRGVDKPTFEQFAVAPDSWFESGSGRVRKVTGRNPLVLVSDSADTPGLPLPDCQPITNNQEPITKSTPVAPKGADPAALPDFERCAEAIYAIYPKKAGHGKAIQAIVKVLKTVGGPTELELQERVRAFAQAVAQWPAEDYDFIPFPATWFNQKRYLDDPDTWIRKPAEDAKKKKGGGAGTESNQALLQIVEAPAGWQTAMWELWGPEWTGAYAAWGTMPPADQRQVRAWLEKNGPGAFECPVPADWHELWGAIFEGRECPETWAEVCAAEREAITSRGGSER